MEMPEPLGVAEGEEFSGQPGEGLAAGQAHGQAAEQGEHGEGDHEGVELQLADKEPVDESDDDTQDEHGSDRSPGRPSPSGAADRGGQDQPDGKHRGQAHDGFEGEIEVSGDQDDAFSDHDDPEHSRGDKDVVQEIVRREELRGQDGPDHHRQNNGGQQRELTGPAGRAGLINDVEGPAAGRRTRNGRGMRGHWRFSLVLWLCGSWAAGACVDVFMPLPPPLGWRLRVPTLRSRR